MKSFGSTLAKDSQRLLADHEIDSVAGGDDSVTATGTIKINFGLPEADGVASDAKGDVDG